MNPLPKTTNNILFYVLALLFIGPLLLAFVLFHTHPDWFKQNTINKGHLIVPPLTIPPKAIVTSANKPLDTDYFDKKWTLLATLPQKCQQRCQQSISSLKKVIKLTGKNQNRMRIVLLGLSQSHRAELSATIHQNYPDTKLLFSRPNYLGDSSAQSIKPSQIYIIDPHGNLIMRYSSDVKALAILKDVKRVLKVSRIA